MSRKIDGLLAVKVEKTRVRRGILICSRYHPQHDARDGGRVLAFERLELIFEATTYQKPEGRASGMASELRRRLRRQIEMYCGVSAVLVLERPGVRVEEFLGRTRELLEVFLGPGAAEAITDDVLRGLDWMSPAGEMR